MPFRATLQDVRLFVAVYEERSFSAAASRERATQSGVSHHVRQLELQLNVNLFFRDKHGVRATPAGEMFYAQATRTLRKIDETVNLFRKPGPHERKSFTVGMLPSVSSHLAALALIRFSRTHPDVEVRLVESVHRLPALVKSGEIDFAIGTNVGKEDMLTRRSLFTAPECLVSSIGSQHVTPTIAPLRPGRIKLINRVRHDERYARIDECLKAQGIEVIAEQEILSASMVVDLISRSDWQVVMPCISLNPFMEGQPLTVSPLRNPDVNFSVVVLEPAARALIPEAETFIAIFREVGRDVVRDWMDRFREAKCL